MTKLKQLLLELNLNQKEVDLFISLVKLGKASASTISRDSGITRTHIYSVISNLIKKGIVSEIEVHGVKTYEPVDHAGLLAFISREQQKLKQLEKKMSEASSLFNTLKVGDKEKTKVRFFNGIKGVKNIYSEISQDIKVYEDKLEFLSFVSPEKLEGILPEFEYFSSHNIKGREIIAKDKLLKKYKSQVAKLPKISYKLWPKEQGQFPTDSIMWGNKMAFIDLSEYPSGIIIENAAMANSFRMWFEFIWNTLQ